MSSTPPSGGRLFVEPLEARIAPTGLTGIANNTAFATDPNYLAYTTQPVLGVKLGFVNAQTQFGIGNGEVFALRLSGSQGNFPGDQLKIFNAATGFGDASVFLQANVGNMVAFFKDKNFDGQVQSDELVGLALGKKSSTLVRGNVDGDIVTNLANDGSLMRDSVGAPGFKISALDVVGNVNGSLLSGGDMNNVTIRGTVHNVLAGTAASGSSFNFTGTAGAVSGTIGGGVYKDFKIGASVNNLTLNALTAGGRIQAGDGGLGAFGGNVNTLNILGDTDTFSVFGGAGGVGNAAVKGGIGGNVDSVLVRGVANSVVNHLITIQAGKGGDNPAFKGGVGGSVNSVFTSFDAFSQDRQSADLLAQNIIVRGGDGGNGFRGGTGGSVTGSFIYGSIADDGVGNNAEIQVYGGHGGLNTTEGAGKGANGGSISQVQVRNLDTLADANASSILVKAGDAGLGKNGGSVDSLTILGKNLIVNAGDGADGFTVGGGGGFLNTINIANLTNLFASSVTLNGGQGGNGGSGNGGSGGDVANVTMFDSDLLSTTTAPVFVINGGTHANGGTSAQAFGGNGGSVLNIQLNDSGISAALAGSVARASIRSGAGGDGFTGGGFGGDIGGQARFQFIGTSFSVDVKAGNGGSILAGGTGDGGVGGSLVNVGIANIPDVSNFPGSAFLPTTLLPLNFVNLLGLTASLSAGTGGSGTVTGAAGGALASVNILAGGSVGLFAGDGGRGDLGASGAGGAVNSSAGAALVGSVTLTAGSGGATGAGGGAGGTINGFVAEGSSFFFPGTLDEPGLQDATNVIPGDIIIRAGNGHAGGAGGSVLNVGTNLNPLNGLPNFGAVTVRAGDGSDSPGLAGIGGDVTTFNGYIGLFGTTSLTAGNGGGSGNSNKTGLGGSVTRTSLQGSGAGFLEFESAQQVTLDAGSAGVSGTAKRGAAGGNVTTALLFNLDPGTVVHHVAAGDGSSGRNRGGDGGSITDVHVGTAGDLVADIGIRSGVRAGYDLATGAGGLFAGVAGTGNISSGLNGNVVNITANAISSIVAGKLARPQLVTMVDQIYLAGLSTSTRANSDGSFSNFDTANLVGSVYNNGFGAFSSGASTFKAGDGLIAATTITQNRNFTPEAALTFDPNGNLVLQDYQQPNPNSVPVNPASVGL